MPTLSYVSKIVHVQQADISHLTHAPLHQRAILVPLYPNPLKTSSDEMDSSDVNDQVGIIVPGSLAGMHRRSPP